MLLIYRCIENNYVFVLCGMGFRLCFSALTTITTPALPAVGKLTRLMDKMFITWKAIEHKHVR